MIIEHINLSAPVEVIEQLKDFYVELLNLEVGFRPKFARKGYWLYHKANAIIHLTVCEDRKPCHDGYLDHVAFQVVGLTSFLKKLEMLHLAYQVDHLEPIGMTQLFFKDPAGNGVELNFLSEKE